MTKQKERKCLAYCKFERLPRYDLNKPPREGSEFEYRDLVSAKNKNGFDKFEISATKKRDFTAKISEIILSYSNGKERYMVTPDHVEPDQTCRLLKKANKFWSLSQKTSLDLKEDWLREEIKKLSRRGLITWPKSYRADGSWWGYTNGTDDTLLKYIEKDEKEGKEPLSLSVKKVKYFSKDLQDYVPEFHDDEWGIRYTGGDIFISLQNFFGLNFPSEIHLIKPKSNSKKTLVDKIIIPFKSEKHEKKFK